MKSGRKLDLPRQHSLCVLSRENIVSSSFQLNTTQRVKERKPSSHLQRPPLTRRLAPGRVWTRDHRSANHLVFSSVTLSSSPHINAFCKLETTRQSPHEGPSVQERTVVYTRLRIPNSPNNLTLPVNRHKFQVPKHTLRVCQSSALNGALRSGSHAVATAGGLFPFILMIHKRIAAAG